MDRCYKNSEFQPGFKHRPQVNYVNGDQEFFQEEIMYQHNDDTSMTQSSEYANIQNNTPISQEQYMQLMNLL